MNLAKIILYLTFLIAAMPALAARVTLVKGSSLLIELEGDTVEAGEEFYLNNPETLKHAAIIRIKKTTDKKALAEILKGRAALGYTLEAKASGASPPGQEKIRKPAQSLFKDSYGILGGYILNSMDVTVTYKDGFGVSHQTSSSMKGSGFSGGGFYDYLFTPDFVGHASGLLEQFNAAGTAAAAGCDGTNNCDANITFLSLYGLGKWYPALGPYRFWVGGGMGYMLALSKSSTALDESLITANQNFTLGLGFDLPHSRKNYIPIMLQYNYFPDSSTVKANMIVLKTGWAWNL